MPEMMVPGQHVTDKLQEILLRKKQEKRQRLLDEFGVVEAQSQLKTRAADQAARAQEYAAQADERTARARDFDRKGKQHAEYRGAVDSFLGSPEFSKLDPEKQGLYKIAGMSPDPSIWQTVINKSMDTPTKPSMVAEYEYAKENGYKGTFEQYQNDDANRRKVNPPAGPNHTPSGIDPTTGRQVVTNNKTGQAFTMDDSGKLVLFLGNRTANPPAERPNTPTASEFMKLADLTKAASPGPPRLMGMRAGKEPDPGAVNARDQALNQIVVRYKTTPAVIQAVLDALQEDPSVTNEEIINDVKASGATPEELQKFQEMLVIARGR